MRRRYSVVFAATLVCVFASAAAIFALASERVPQTTTTLSQVADLTINPLPPMGETKEQHKARLEAEGRLVPFSGPATMGTTLTIANKSVQLPDDAYVESFVISVDCSASPCPETPAFVIKRGESSTWVSLQTGARYRTVLRPESSDAFAFLDDPIEASGPSKEPPQQQVPQQVPTEPHCDFDLPDRAPEGAQPVEPDAFTPTVIAEAIRAANRPDWGQPHITITNAWQVTDELKAAAGYSEAGAGALILLTVRGESRLLMLGVRGAPGPARIHSVKGDFVIVSQGYGYVAFNYRTGELFRCGKRAGG